MCEAVMRLPLSSGAAWGQLRDFRSSARHDPFHAQITIEGNVPRAGAKLLIEHRYLLKKSVRLGRICGGRRGRGLLSAIFVRVIRWLGFRMCFNIAWEQFQKMRAS